MSNLESRNRYRKREAVVDWNFKVLMIVYLTTFLFLNLATIEMINIKYIHCLDYAIALIDVIIAALLLLLGFFLLI